MTRPATDHLFPLTLLCLGAMILSPSAAASDPLLDLPDVQTECTFAPSGYNCQTAGRHVSGGNDAVNQAARAASAALITALDALGLCESTANQKICGDPDGDLPGIRVTLECTTITTHYPDGTVTTERSYKIYWARVAQQSVIVPSLGTETVPDTPADHG